MAQTIQAGNVADALRVLGLRQRGEDRDFSVRTTGSGSSGNGFGHAVGHLRTRKAHDTVLAKQQELVRMGVSVMIYPDGIHAFVTSQQPAQVSRLSSTERA